MNPEALYKALLADAEIQPPDWNVQGRQANAWKKFGYIPQDIIETGGANTKQVSRALEYAFGIWQLSAVVTNERQKQTENTKGSYQGDQVASHRGSCWSLGSTACRGRDRAS